MNLNSELFKPIRISEHEEAPASPKRCAHYGCHMSGLYKAPVSREREGEYYHFCYEHVKDYNKNYNYFAGMSYEDLLTYQRETVTGLRPTWKMGQSPSTAHMFGFHPRRFDEDEEPAPKAPERTYTPLVKRCFAALHLDPPSTPEAIETQYKALIKRLHPDANGGDRSTEDQFREVIEAHDTLKSCGFC